MKNFNLVVTNFYETFINIVILLLSIALISYVLSFPAKLIDKGLVKSTVTINQLKNW